MVSEEDKEAAAKAVVALCEAVDGDNELVIGCALIIKAAVRDNPALTGLLLEKAKEIDDAIDIDLAGATDVQC